MAAVKPIREVAPSTSPVVAAPPAPQGKRLTVAIGCRWKPNLYSVVNDRQAGVYEEVNSQIASKTEDFVQRALLATVRDPASLQRIEAARVARRITNGAQK